MPHHCSSILIHCIDFRLGPDIAEYMKGKNLLGDCDIVSIAGAAKDLTQGDKEFVLRQIEISKKLHEMKNVILMNHTDCGAYGGGKAFASESEENERHVSEMKKAKEVVLERFPDLEVQAVLAHIRPEGKVEFQPVSL